MLIMASGDKMVVSERVILFFSLKEESVLQFHIKWESVRGHEERMMRSWLLGHKLNLQSILWAIDISPFINLEWAIDISQCIHLVVGHNGAVVVMNIPEAGISLCLKSWIRVMKRSTGFFLILHTWRRTRCRLALSRRGSILRVTQGILAWLTL